MALPKRIDENKNDNKLVDRVAEGNEKTVSLIDKIISGKKSNEFSKMARDQTADYIEKQDKRIEERLLLRRIANNTDTIIDILKDIKAGDGSSNKPSLLDLLKLAIPALLALPGLINPEKYKTPTTAAKAIIGTLPHALQAGAKAADMAATAGKAAGVAGHASKALGTLAKGASTVADSPLMRKFTRYTSGAMMIGRGIEGDYTGAAMEGASLALNEASHIAKNPKAKLGLLLASLTTDAAIIGRDWLNGKHDESIKKDESDKGLFSSIFGKSNSSQEESGSIVSEPQQSSMAPMLAAAGAAGALAFVKSGKAATPAITAASVAANPLRPVAPVNASKITSIVSPVGKEAGKTVLKAGAGKMAGKLIPGVGLALGAYGAVSRAQDGDYLGAAGEAISGLATLIPGVGTAIGAVIQGGLMYRDYVKATSNDSKELNGIVKENTIGLGTAAEANRKTIEKNSEQIDKTNKILKENSDDLTFAVKETDSLLVRFTKDMGNSVISWIKTGANVFQNAFNMLTDISSRLWNWVKNSTVGKAVETVYESAKEFAVGQGAQYDLGKHGGTLTGAIMSHESKGNYGIYNWSKNGKYYEGKSDNNKTSLNSVIAMQASGKVNAYGGYQMIKDTMKAAKTHLKLSGNEMMTQELQDRMFQDYLVKEKRKGIYNYLTGKSDNLGQAVLEAAMEWSSIGVPFDTKGYHQAVKKGQSYYAGDGVNKARTSPDEVGLAMQQQRQRYMALKKAGLSENEAYKKSFDKDALEKTKGISRDDKNKSSGGFMQSVGSMVDKGLDAISNSSVGKTVGAIFEDKTASKGVSTSPGSLQSTIQKQESTTKPAAAKAAAATGAAATNASNKNKEQARYDIDAICSYAVRKAVHKSRAARAADKTTPFYCAKYVRLAVQHGDRLKGSGTWGESAYMLVDALPKVGWVRTSGPLAKGDIAVFPKSGSKHGHVCIWTGSVWVSDWIQGNNPQPNSAANYPYILFRAASATSNGQAVGAEATGTVASKSEGSLGGSEASDTGLSVDEEEKSVFEKATDAAIGGLAALGAGFANSDMVKSALNFVNSAKKDKWKQSDPGEIDMTGFDLEMRGQKSGPHNYNYGNGGNINEDELFNPNLGRQEDNGINVLGNAGDLGGIVRQQDNGINVLGRAGDLGGINRQQDNGKDVLGNAGNLGGINRQEDNGKDVLGNAGNLGGINRQGENAKNKKRKWYEKLFGNRQLFGDIASIFGVKDIFDIGTGIFDIAKGDGKVGDYVNLAAPYLLKALTPKEKNPNVFGSGENYELGPDYESRNQIDGYVTDINKQYDEIKNRPKGKTNKDGSSSKGINPPSSPLPSNAKKNNPGLGAPLVTRNPDSIFREVSIAMMRASTT